MVCRDSAAGRLRRADDDVPRLAVQARSAGVPRARVGRALFAHVRPDGVRAARAGARRVRPEHVRREGRRHPVGRMRGRVHVVDGAFGSRAARRARRVRHLCSPIPVLSKPDVLEPPRSAAARGRCLRSVRCRPPLGCSGDPRPQRVSWNPLEPQDHRPALLASQLRAALDAGRRTGGDVVGGGRVGRGRGAICRIQQCLLVGLHAVGASLGAKRLTRGGGEGEHRMGRVPAGAGARAPVRSASAFTGDAGRRPRACDGRLRRGGRGVEARRRRISSGPVSAHPRLRFCCLLAGGWRSPDAARLAGGLRCHVDVRRGDPATVLLPGCRRPGRVRELRRCA